MQSKPPAKKASSARKKKNIFRYTPILNRRDTTHKHRAMPAEKQLRYPFKVAAKAGSFVSTKVTTGVDTTYDYTMKAFDGVKQK